MAYRFSTGDTPTLTRFRGKTTSDRAHIGDRWSNTTVILSTVRRRENFFGFVFRLRRDSDNVEVLVLGYQ